MDAVIGALGSVNDVLMSVATSYEVRGCCFCFVAFHHS